VLEACAHFSRRDDSAVQIVALYACLRNVHLPHVFGHECHAARPGLLMDGQPAPDEFMAEERDRNELHRIKASLTFRQPSLAKLE
jgi:hypothetical protein